MDRVDRGHGAEYRSGTTVPLGAAGLAKGNDEQLDTLSVCSDSHVADASENGAREEARTSTDETQLASDDPTEDWSYVSAWEVVGGTAKDSDRIKRWLDEEANRFCNPDSSIANLPAVPVPEINLDDPRPAANGRMSGLGEPSHPETANQRGRAFGTRRLLAQY